MFSSAIDPTTGRPFDFANFGAGGNGAYGTNNQTWFRQGSISGDTSGGEGGMNGGDLNLFTNDALNNPEFLASIGYTGPSPYAFQGSQDSGAMAIAPEFQQFLTSRGLTLGSSMTPDQQMYRGRAFDASGNPVGTEAQWATEDDPGGLFGMAIMAAAGFGVASAAGVGAGAAGGGFSGAGGAGTNAALIESQLGTAGYGASSAGLGSSAYGAGAAYPGFQVAGGGSVAPEGWAWGGEAGSSAWGGGEAGVTAGGGGTAGGVNALGAGAGYTTPGLGSTGASSGLLGSLNSALGTSFTGQQALGAAGSLVNGLISSSATNRAANQLADSTREANALWAPYREAGVQGLGQVRNLLANPSSITSDPGYQFQRDQGQQQLDRRAAASGNYYSGAQIKAGAEYNQNYASNALDRALSRYSNLAQIGATGTTNISNNLTGLGTAQAGATMQNASNWGNALNSGVASLNRSQYDQAEVEAYNRYRLGRGS